MSEFHFPVVDSGDHRLVETCHGVLGLAHIGIVLDSGVEIPFVEYSFDEPRDDCLAVFDMGMVVHAGVCEYNSVEKQAVCQTCRFARLDICVEIMSYLY